MNAKMLCTSFDMKYVLISVALAAVAYILFYSIRTICLVRISAGLVADARPFVSTEGVRALLVLGDSTGVGVGSSAEGSVAARLSTYLDASVENHAKSGARADDIGGQLKKVRKSLYDMALIQVGANDIIRFGSSRKAGEDIEASLSRAREVSDRVVLLTGGKIGDAPFFPKPFGFLWINRAATLRERFMVAAEKHGVVYIDLFNAKDPFASDAERYYAPDGLHLTADGYGFWFDEVKKSIEKTWPEL